MTRVKLVSVTKRFGKTVAVDNVSFVVEQGELFTLLGPSGCGKTTTLRLIAGLEYPDSGKIYFDDQDVTYLKPYERNTAMVFQNYALWPHMTVFDNIAYGLKIRGVPKDEIKRRVKEVLELVGLSGLENRYPHQLSGGQQQRVALARALVVQPKVLLLDEPLSNLDALLRVKMREELKRIQRELRITTIYVTHDQEEAMCLSDRIAVMDKGKILQVGSPREIYENPKNLFVATFIGRSSALKGKVVQVRDGYAILSIGNQKILGIVSDEYPVKEGDSAVAIVKPEDVVLEPISSNLNELWGEVELAMFLGHVTMLRIRIDSQTLYVYVDPDTLIERGQIVRVYVDPGDVLIFPSSEWKYLKLL